MSKTVTLRHGTYAAPRKAVYFYDGLLVAVDGLLTIPTDHPHWVKRAWIDGYNLTPAGERLWDFNQVEKEIQLQTA